MSTFASLLRHRKGQNPAEAQQEARRLFPARVESSRVTLRKAGQRGRAGKQIVLGLATYSADDLALLDELDARLEENPELGDVQVFDVLSCRTSEDFGKFISGIGDVRRTPVVGVVTNGKLVAKASGLTDVRGTLRRLGLLG